MIDGRRSSTNRPVIIHILLFRWPTWFDAAVHEAERCNHQRAASKLSADQTQHRLTKSESLSRLFVPHVCVIHGCALPVYFRAMFDDDLLGFLAAATRPGAHPRKCLLKLTVEEYACVTVCEFHDGAEGQHRYRTNVDMRAGACKHRSVIEIGYEINRSLIEIGCCT